LLRHVLKDDSLVFLQSSDLHDPQASECLMPGFFPFEAVGNGDDIGLYWPLGAENPIILTSSHDAWAFIPEASSVEAFLRQRFAEYWDTQEQEADDFDVQAMNADRDRLSALVGQSECEAHPEEGDRKTAVERLLVLDPASPLLNTILGDMAVDDGCDADAERFYQKALMTIPEYTAARYELAMLLRRRSDPDTVRELALAVSSPMCLDGGCFFGNHVLPRDRQDLHEKSRQILCRVAPGDIPREFKTLVARLQNVSFAFHPSEVLDWKPLHEVGQMLLDENQPKLAYGWFLNALHVDRRHGGHSAVLHCLQALEVTCAAMVDHRRAEHVRVLRESGIESLF
jgi:hypothetical protein